MAGALRRLPRTLARQERRSPVQASAATVAGFSELGRLWPRVRDETHRLLPMPPDSDQTKSVRTLRLAPGTRVSRQTVGARIGGTGARMKRCGGDCYRTPERRRSRRAHVRPSWPGCQRPRPARPCHRSFNTLPTSCARAVSVRKRCCDVSSSNFGGAIGKRGAHSRSAALTPTQIHDSQR